MKWTTKQLTTMALLTAIALAIHVAEAQIPPFVAIPGVKLGLANIITIYAAFSIGGGAAAMILIARILLGSMFGGGAVSFLYSFAGGMLCLLVTLLLRRVLSREQIWVAGVIGAIAHNIGQILVAVIVTGTPSIVSYLPILLISGVLTGLFTGFAAQAVVNRIHRKP
jgi:heptaprenyl diphosphate synthase